MLPDVPTIAEAGVPGYEAANWIGIVAPAGTPAAIVEKLHKEIAAIQESPEVQKQFANEGAEIVRMSSAEFGEFIGRKRQMGTRREGGRHQGAMTAARQFGPSGPARNMPSRAWYAGRRQSPVAGTCVVPGDART